MSPFKSSRFVLLTVVLLASAFSSPSGASEPKPTAADSASAAKPASDDGLFKYTITTDIDVETEQVEILVAMNDRYPRKYDLDCEGDGEFEYQDLTGNQLCVYKKNSGKHQISVRGELSAMFLCARTQECPEGALCEMPRWYPAPSYKDHSYKAVLSIDSWGNVAWKSMYAFAANCQALGKLPGDSPNLSQVKNMDSAFAEAHSFNQPIGNWDVSNVTVMDWMFYNATSFDQPLDRWDVSNVKSMYGMFEGAKAFSHYPKSWVVPSDALAGMFKGTKVEAEAKKTPLKTK